MQCNARNAQDVEALDLIAMALQHIDGTPLTVRQRNVLNNAFVASIPIKRQSIQLIIT